MVGYATQRDAGADAAADHARAHARARPRRGAQARRPALPAPRREDAGDDPLRGRRARPPAARSRSSALVVSTQHRDGRRRRRADQARPDRARARAAAAAGALRRAPARRPRLPLRQPDREVRDRRPDGRRRASPAARSSSTPTAAPSRTAAAPSRARTRRRSTARPPTRRATSPRTSSPPGSPSAASCRSPTRSASPTRSRSTSTASGPSAIDASRGSRSSSGSTSTCARPRSCATSTCAGRSTPRPPPTATSAATTPSSPGSAPTRSRLRSRRPPAARRSAPSSRRSPSRAQPRADEEARGGPLADRALGAVEAQRGAGRRPARPRRARLGARARAPGRRTSAGARRRARRAGRSSPARPARAPTAAPARGSRPARTTVSIGQPCGQRSGLPSRVVDPLDHVVAEGVAELVGVHVRLGRRVAHEVGEQPLDDPVLAHRPLGPLAAGLGQDRLLARAALDEPLGLEPLQHLAGRGARDAEHLGDARGERRMRRVLRVVLADREREEVDRLEVFVDRVALTAIVGRIASRGRARRPCGGRRRPRTLTCVGDVLPRGRGSSATSSRLSAGSSSRSRSGSSSCASACAAIAWRVILRASYPDERLRFRSVFGAYVAGVGVNSIVPARAGDVVKLYLIKHRIDGSSYATLAPTLLAETLLDVVRRRRADRLGALRSASCRPTRSTRGCPRSTGASSLEYAARDGDRARAARRRARDRRDRLRRARRRLAGADRARLRDHARAAPASSGASSSRRRSPGCCGSPRSTTSSSRSTCHATIHNALLALVVDSLATLFPATPGGAGTKQGLIVFLFRGRGDLDVAAARLQRRHEHRRRRLQPAARRRSRCTCMARTVSWRGRRLRGRAVGRSAPEAGEARIAESGPACTRRTRCSLSLDLSAGDLDDSSRRRITIEVVRRQGLSRRA